MAITRAFATQKINLLKLRYGVVRELKSEGGRVSNFVFRFGPESSESVRVS